MRHRGFFSSAVDACSFRVGPSHVAPYNVAGPSRLALSAPAPSSSPSPPPPPISTLTSALAPTSVSLPSSSSPHASTSAGLSSRLAKERRSRRPAKPVTPGLVSHRLSFLYPPSCLELTRTPIVRAKSSLAPTSAVAAPATAAQQLATPHDERDHRHHHHHLSAQLDPDFTFLRHQYDPPHHLIDHPPSDALLQQDADSHLDDEEAFPHLPDQQTEAIPTQSQQRTNASVAALASLRRQSEKLRQSLRDDNPIQTDTIVKQCRRLVLQACRVSSSLHAKPARAIAAETASDCAFRLLAAAQPVAAADVLRHLLVKLGWNPRSLSDLPSPLPSESGPALNLGASSATSAAGRLLLVAQQVISQLTLAPSPFSPRPTRRFESQHHLDAVTSLMSAMQLSQLPRSTASQTSLIRAMIASSQTRLAVQTYASEVRAWWAAHRQARRPSPHVRRKAALVVQFGKPSSQALREVTRAMQHLEELVSRIRPDLLPQLPQREQEALHAKRTEFADSLLELVRLVRGGLLPLPPTATAPEIAWILSAACRFEATLMLDDPVAKKGKSTSPSLDAAEQRRLEGAAQMIRYFLGEYMRSLPDGQTRSEGNVMIQGDPVVRPAVGIAVYNRLIHYALSTLNSPSMCKEVFQHMTQLRHPPLEPDAVTFNTILRQATTQRYASLARAVLITKQPEHSQQQHIAVDDKTDPNVIATTSNADVASPTAAAAAAASVTTPAFDLPAADTELRPIRPMIQQIDTAIAQADSYRLLALLQYVTASGLFLRRYRHEPGHAGVKELVMRIYPALNKQRYAHTRFVDSLDPQQQRSSLSLRPKANRASRHAILNPHVLTATLNLAAKAGKTGLALRIWRLIKRTSLQSALQSPDIDVSTTPWQIPVEAATILMSVLATEAARAPRIRRQPLRSHRQSTSLGAVRSIASRTSRLAIRRQYARGWNMVASFRGRSYAARLRSTGHMHNSAGEFGEGLRWRAAQLLAKREYAFLVHHWQLFPKLSSGRRQRLEELVQPGQSGSAEEGSRNRRAVVDVEDGLDVGVQPDSRFYDALLDVFGRRAGMVQRSRRHRSRAETLAQLRRGYKQVVQKSTSFALSAVESGQGPVQQCAAHNGATASEQGTSTPTLTQPMTPIDDLRTLTTTQLLHTIVSRINCNSRGRWTSHPPDPFLVRVLIDMEVLGIEIPVAYRWILAHCAVAAHLLQNNEVGKSRGETGAFSPFRGARIKTVGLVARRRNSKAG